MTINLLPSRIPLVVALMASLAGGCATTGAAASSPGTADRDAVVTCYSTGYRKRSGVAPVLDDKTDVAADQLLKKYGGSTKKACDAITAALGSCGGSTMTSLVSCDQKTAHGVEIDPTTKAQIETNVREHDQQSGQGQRGY